MCKQLKIFLGLFFIGTFPAHAQKSITYYCIVDQVVGIQSSKSSSGLITPKKEKFVLKYTPAVFMASPKDEDPLYMTPTLETSFLSTNDQQRTFAFTDIIGPFSFGGRSVGSLKQSSMLLGIVGPKDLLTAKTELQKRIKESQQEVEMGMYLIEPSFYGMDAIQIFPVNGMLHGLAIESSLSDNKKSTEKGARRIFGYLRYFTCEKF